MKQIVCVDPNEFKLVNTDVPSLKQGEVLVKIRRVGICGTDLHAYRGNQPYFTYPRVLGHELSGIIEEIGENNRGFKKGDQVAIIPYLECGTCIACRNGKTNCCMSMRVLGVHVDGGMREWLNVPVDHLVNANSISLDEAAILEPLCIGAHAVRRAKITAGENVLVIGSGPIGLGVMSFAKQQGANVIAMDINEERLAFCKDWANVDATVDALNEPVKQIESVTNGEFPTTVFDATGNVHSMNQSFEYVAHGGTLVFVGLVKQDITFSDPDFHKKELTLMGSRNATRQDFEYVLEAMQNGQLDIDQYITHRCHFDHMINEFENWTKSETKVIKAIVEL